MKPDRAFITVAALGVVFGDIGTSPLYAFRVSMGAAQETSSLAVMGVLSLIFWSLIIVVTLKYVLLILRVDNGGEGGILALAALLDLHRAPAKTRSSPLLIVAVLGGALLFGDAIITPAISVLSATEGLHDISPAFQDLTVPLACLILGGLFFSQRFGIMRIAVLFGPVMLVWFGVLATSGLVAVVAHLSVLKAISPHYALVFALAHPGVMLAVLGGVFLTVTGGEALYADLGQFGRPAITRAWLLIALPALLLNYFGQGAQFLANPGEGIENTFYALFSKELLLPVVLLATLATVIASQAVITGLFSLGRQAIQLGLLPPMAVRHMTGENEHDVYIPVVNTIVGMGSIAIVLGFRTSDQLADAYGVAVAGAMITTTVLYIGYQVRSRQTAGKSFAGLLVLLAPILLVDIAFLSASSGKLVSGGLVPLLLALAVSIIVVAWRKGRERMLELQKTGEIKYSPGQIRPIEEGQTPRAGVFLVRPGQMWPLALQELSELTGSDFNRIIVLSVWTTSRPRVDATTSVTITRLDEAVARIDVRVGYMQQINVPALIGPALDELGLESGKVTYIANLERPMTPQSLRSLDGMFYSIFAILARLARRSTDRFQLPPSRTIEIGMPRQL